MQGLFNSAQYTVGLQKVLINIMYTHTVHLLEQHWVEELDNASHQLLLRLFPSSVQAICIWNPNSERHL